MNTIQGVGSGLQNDQLYRNIPLSLQELMLERDKLIEQISLINVKLGDKYPCFDDGTRMRSKEVNVLRQELLQKKIVTETKLRVIKLKIRSKNLTKRSQANDIKEYNTSIRSS